VDDGKRGKTLTQVEKHSNLTSFVEKRSPAIIWKRRSV
jgi:hypothetical protein